MSATQLFRSDRNDRISIIAFANFSIMILLLLLLAVKPVAPRLWIGGEGSRGLSGEGSSGKGCASPPTKHRVVFPNHLAGRAGTGNYETFSGYIEIAPENFYFYVFFGPRDKNASSPLVMYTNGGPGCSSMEAATTENSPLLLLQIAESCPFYPDGCDYSAQLSANAYAWNAHSHLLYVDNPRNVGFSYGAGPPANSTVMAAQDMVNFLLGFYRTYPQLRPNALIISGESYAGHYLPAWGHFITQHNRRSDPGSLSHINLRGVMLGNGWINISVQTGSLQDYALKANVVNSTFRLPPRNHDDDATPSSDNATGLHAEMAAYLGYTPNAYDTRLRNIVCPGCMGYNYTAWTLWMGREDVRAALGVCSTATYSSFGVAASGCLPSMVAGVTYDVADNFSYSGAIGALIDEGVKVMLYVGMQDTVCNYVGVEAVVRDLPWSQRDAFNALPMTTLELAGAPVGSMKRLGGLTFALIDGSGHMVPADEPATAALLLQMMLADIGDAPGAGPGGSSSVSGRPIAMLLSAVPFGLSAVFVLATLSVLLSSLVLLIARGLGSNSYVRVIKHISTCALLFSAALLLRALMEADGGADAANSSAFAMLGCAFAATLWTNLTTTQCLLLCLSRPPLDLAPRSFVLYALAVYGSALCVAAPQLSPFESTRKTHLYVCWLLLCVGAMYNLCAVLSVRLLLRRLPDRSMEDKVQRAAMDSLSRRVLLYPLWQCCVLLPFPVYFVAAEGGGGGVYTAASALLVLICPSAGSGYAAIFLFSQPRAWAIARQGVVEVLKGLCSVGGWWAGRSKGQLAVQGAREVDRMPARALPSPDHIPPRRISVPASHPAVPVDGTSDLSPTPSSPSAAYNNAAATYTANSTNSTTVSSLHPPPHQSWDLRPDPAASHHSLESLAGMDEEALEGVLESFRCSLSSHARASAESRGL